ncbi:hypothetical protein V9T40_003734 [Parthenolecanium corni]|uniref:Uncharacterized protein n=1 Tax=Parthenolecanium corni TaxID=536013 RepID=A0AAN9TR90_9HEMI
MEPMTLGSPNTSYNASIFESSVSNSQFLPSFLLGSESGNPSPYTSPKSFSPNKSQFAKYPSPQHNHVSERNSIPNQISAIEKHDGPPIISLSDFNSIRSMNQSSLGHDFNATQNNTRYLITFPQPL